MSWLSYASRTYDTLRSSMINRIRQLLPEMTDLSDNNVLIRLTSLWAQVAEQLHFYLDTLARESFPATARSYRSLLAIAKNRGISVPLSNSASVTLVYSIDVPAPVGGQLIPAGTVAKVPGTSLVYATAADLTIPAGETSGFVKALQRTFRLNQAAENLEAVTKLTATGEAGEKFYLPSNVVEGSIRMVVDSEDWEYKRSAHASALTLSEAKHFFVTRDVDTRVVVYVGDGVIGSTIPEGASVRFDYAICQGTDGNAAPDTISEITSSITPATGVTRFSVTNPQSAYGGRFILPIETLRNYIMSFSLDRERVILLSDIRAYALGFQDVIDASCTFNPNCIVKVKLLTEGGSTAPVTDLQSAFDDNLTSVLAMGVTAEVSLAELASLSFTLKIKYEVGAVTNAVNASVEAALQDYMAVGKLQIGQPVFVSDLYEVIEAVDGVESSELIRVNALAEFVKVYDPGFTSSIDAVITSTSNTLSDWSLTHVDRTPLADTYQVFINGSYVGQVVVPVNGRGTLTIPAGGVTIAYSSVSSPGAQWRYSVAYYDGTKIVLNPEVYPTLDAITFL